MKKLLTIGLICVSTAVSAQEYAKVVGVQEVYSVRNVPQQHCTTVDVPVYHQQAPSGGAIGGMVDNTFGSTQGLVGAIAGGLIGSRIGGGSGKRWATAAGAVIGTQVGDRYRQNRQQQIVTYQKQQQCSMVNVQENFVSGYQVTYEYNGRLYTGHKGFRPQIGSLYPVDISIR